MSKRIRPPFKIHGGKYYLSKWVVEHFPEGYEAMDYIEPYIGAGSVILNKEKSPLEVVNDINEGIVQIYRALRDEPKHFIRKLKYTTYSENVFNRELKRTEFEDYMDHAFNEFVLRRMSRGGLKKAFAWSDRQRGGQPGDVNAWNTILGILPEIAERLSEIHVFNKPALEIITSFDDENALCYCDPPYLTETRTSQKAYEDEMTDDDHIELSKALNNFRGKVIISGYPSTLYNRLYQNWNMVEKQIANHASQQKKKTTKTEVIWTNY